MEVILREHVDNLGERGEFDDERDEDHDDRFDGAEDAR